MTSMIEKAARRVKLVADGGTINGTYRQYPNEALEAFRADLRLLTRSILNPQDTSGSK